MVNIDVIKKRLNQLSVSLNKMERFKDISLDDFLGTKRDVPDLSHFYLSKILS